MGRIGKTSDGTMRLIKRFELGDLVQLNKFWKRRIGIVVADGTSWWVIPGHYDIAGCICSPADVDRILRRGAVPKQYLRYMR